jgi:hypothetical protein
MSGYTLVAGNSLNHGEVSELTFETADGHFHAQP